MFPGYVGRPGSQGPRRMTVSQSDILHNFLILIIAYISTQDPLDELVIKSYHYHCININHKQISYKNELYYKNHLKSKLPGPPCNLAVGISLALKKGLLPCFRFLLKLSKTIKPPKKRARTAPNPPKAAVVIKAG